QLGDLVVGFTGGVVTRSAELANAADLQLVDAIQRRVAARNEQRQKWQLGRLDRVLRVLQVRRAQVPDQVVDADDRQISRIGEPERGLRADVQRTGQAGTR